MASVPIEHGFELRGEGGSLRALLRDIWRARDLLRVLARKDFFVRYRRASFGVFWAVGLPLMQAAVLAFVFTRIVDLSARFGATEIPYPVYVFSGILPWTFFNGGVQSGVTAIVDGSALATRIYFPRAILPLVLVFSSAYGFVPGLVILVALALGFGAPVGPDLLYLVPAVALTLALTLVFALVFSAMQVYFRDVKHIVQAITLPWFWASGVFFPIERMGDLRQWLEINPAVGMIQLYRAAFDGAAPNFETSVWWSLGWTIVLLIAAALLHRRYDRVFVDLL